jgi:hypothetical protein
VKRCRKLVSLLGCAGSVEAHDPAATQGNIASSSHAASSARLVEEEEEAHEEEEEEESNGEEEYDEDYGPPPTQPSQLPKRNQPKKDWQSPSPFQKPIPRGGRKKKPEETRSKNNEDRTSKRGRST